MNPLLDDVLRFFPQMTKLLGIALFLHGEWKIYRGEYFAGQIARAAGLVIAFAYPILRFLIFLT